MLRRPATATSLSNNSDAATDQQPEAPEEKKGRFGFDARRHLHLLALLVAFSIFLLTVLVPDRYTAATFDPSNAVQPLLTTDTD